MYSVPEYVPVQADQSMTETAQAMCDTGATESAANERADSPVKAQEKGDAGVKGTALKESTLPHIKGKGAKKAKKSKKSHALEQLDVNVEEGTSKRRCWLVTLPFITDHHKLICWFGIQ